MAPGADRTSAGNRDGVGVASSPANYDAPGVSPARTDQLTDPVRLFLEGYDQLVVGPEFDDANGSQEARALIQVRRVFEGTPYAQPVPRNPQVTVFRVSLLLANTRPVRARVESEPQYEAVEGVVRSRVARLPLDASIVAASVAAGARGGDVTLTLDLTTPWASQSCRLELPGWQSPDLCAGLLPISPRCDPSRCRRGAGGTGSRLDNRQPGAARFRIRARRREPTDRP